MTTFIGMIFGSCLGTVTSLTVIMRTMPTSIGTQWWWGRGCLTVKEYLPDFWMPLTFPLNPLPLLSQCKKGQELTRHMYVQLPYRVEWFSFFLFLKMGTLLSIGYIFRSLIPKFRHTSTHCTQVHEFQSFHFLKIPGSLNIKKMWWKLA